MSEATTTLGFRATTTRDALTEVVRLGAQRMLTAALEAEVETYIEEHKHVLDAKGRRLVERNGHLPGRQITTGIGPLDVRQPRIDDRRVDENGERLRFTSSILPPYLRRTKSIDDLIPWLYLKGVSTGGFSDALASILCPAFDHFGNVYQAKYPKAVECLTKDRDALLCFYDFPAEHWQHLRTTNPIESTFGTVRLRTKRTKGCGSRVATLTMVFKLAHAAQRSWRKLNGHQLLADVIQGVRFIDGTKAIAA